MKFGAKMNSSPITATFVLGDLLKTHIQGEQHLNLPNTIQGTQLNLNFRYTASKFLEEAVPSVAGAIFVLKKVLIVYLRFRFSWAFGIFTRSVWQP